MTHAKVEQRHLDIARSSLYGVMGYLGISVMTDEAVASVASRIADWEALATAPPEQAALEQPDQYDKLQPPTTTTIMPDQPEAYPGQAFFHKHNANIKRAEEHATQPQPASDGALDAEIVNPYLVRCFNCGTDKPGNGHMVPLCGDCYEQLRIALPLASHDQKVRAEVLRDLLTKHEYMNGTCLCREFRLPPYGEKELNEFRAQSGDWMQDIRWHYWLTHVLEAAAAIRSAQRAERKEPT